MDWKRKLSSRKFWAMVADFVSMLIVAIGYTDDAGVKIAALILGAGGIIAYILGESAIDAASVSPTAVSGIQDDGEGN